MCLGVWLRRWGGWFPGSEMEEMEWWRRDGSRFKRVIVNDFLIFSSMLWVGFLRAGCRLCKVFEPGD